jgi:hypothetical protein
MSTITHYYDVIIIGTGSGAGTVMPLMLPTKPGLSAPTGLPPYRAVAE